MGRGLVLVLSLAAALPAVAGAPVTGRHQDLSLSRANMIESTEGEFRLYLGTLEAERRIDRRSATARRVQRVFTRLLPHAKRLNPAMAGLRWEALVTKGDGASLFAMPNGRIVVNAGWIEDRGLSEAELALAIAHEMSHVLADHMLERVSSIAASRPLAKMSAADVLRALREHWYLAREIEPLMRIQEREADRIGIAIVRAAGFALAEAITLFDKMAHLEERREGISLVRSHDSARDRKTSLLGWMRARELALAGST
jgi:predicted Zn-dependent protease